MCRTTPHDVSPVRQLLIGARSDGVVLSGRRGDRPNEEVLAL